MGGVQKYYDVEDFNRWKRKQGSAYRIPPRANLLAATDYVRKFFDARKSNWAAMGSLAMLCLGSPRVIPDIHVVYDDRDFQRIRMKLETDPRVRLPNGMNSLFASKLLVSTGPKFKDAGCTENVDVEVNLCPPGSSGCPPNDVLRNNQVMLSLNMDGKMVNIKGLNVLYLVKTTVHFCTSQDIAWEPKMDLVFLCKRYNKEIESIRGQLNARQVQENFLGTPFFSKLSAKEQHLCYHVLLGKEPPPSMFLTPPGVAQGQLASAASRPPVASRKSAPSLRSEMQPTQAFLTPPRPNKHKSASSAPANVPSMQFTPPINQPLAGTGTSSNTTRDSRLRYRNSSAPTTPNTSRNVSPEGIAHHARPISANARGGHQGHVNVYQAQSVSMQKIPSSSKPQVVANTNHPNTKSVGIRQQRSMPGMSGATTNAVPIYAHKPAASASELIDIQPPGATYASFPDNPGLLNSQTSSLRDQEHTVSNPAPITQPRAPQPANPAIHAEQTSKMTLDHSTSLVPVNLIISNTKTKESSLRSLKIVGPEGLYATSPEVSGKSATQGPMVQRQTQDNSSAFIFELDATPLQVHSEPTPAREFIAELPGETSVMHTEVQPINQVQNARPEAPISPPQVPAHPAHVLEYRDSPVSPPTTYRQTFASSQTLIPEPLAPAPKQVTNPPAFESLPPSLMIGFRGGQRRSPDNLLSRPCLPSHPTNSQKPLTKYQRYYSPPSSVPSSREPSPRQGPQTVYKAYSLPVSPPLNPGIVPAPQQPSPATAISVPLTRLPPSIATANSPVETASPSSVYSSPGSTVPAPLKPKSFHLPNPLSANPPTPRVAPHTKDDFHQTPRLRSETEKNEPATFAPHIQTQHRHPWSGQGQLPTRHDSGHQRNLSHESQSSTTSHDSEKLAQEYQLDLPTYGSGYGNGRFIDEHDIQL